MSGKYCPKCYRLTFFLTSTGRKCTQCGYSEIDRARLGIVEKNQLENH
jgi:predicted nucleic-acid-binding Zn-ribbon protein